MDPRTLPTWQGRYLQRFYDRDRGFRDGTQEFHDLCRANLPPRGKILEIGAGPSNPTSRFLAGHGEVHGLDPDPAVRENDALVSASLLEGDRFPFPDECFDGAVSNYVLEHVPRPLEHLQEVRRVLRPGGMYVFRAPNLFHYVVAVSALTPHWVHMRLANRLRRLPAGSHDPYPTVYRINTRRAVRRFAAQAGLGVCELRVMEKEPMYGLSSRALFLLFLAYERCVNATPWLEDLRANILGVLRREAE